MRVSFTGTRFGMSEWQEEQLTNFLKENVKRISVFAHGACSGSDEKAHRLARLIGGASLYIAIFPSTSKTRVFGLDAQYVAEPAPPLERDMNIVNLGRDLLLATPLTMVKTHRSGTWSTIGYAEKKKIPVNILWRNPK